MENVDVRRVAVSSTDWLDAKLFILQHYRFGFLFVLRANVNEEVVATQKVSWTWADLAWSVDLERNVFLF
jgi:hypothetical protein